VFGAGIVAAIQARAFGPSIDWMSRAERDSLPLVAALYCIDVVLAVSTLAAVAARGVVQNASISSDTSLARAEP
jgi:hypothetical protein